MAAAKPPTVPRDETAPDPAQAGAAIELRPAEAGDREAIAAIIYEAFGAIHDRHRFDRDFPTPEAADQVAAGFIGHPSIWGVVAESGGRIVGSNFLDERGPIRGVGPITVDPEAQVRGIGRQLMESVIERGAGSAGIRLLQDTFNNQSLGLYSSLGFVVREPIALMGGRPRIGAPDGFEVRPMEEADLPACERLHRAVHGFERTTELRDALAMPALEPFVAMREGRIVAYAAGIGFFPAVHGVAEGDAEMLALILGALGAGDSPASFLLPTRQAELFHACLEAGLRIVKPMTYMTLGDYEAPSGSWFPSVLY